ncbi:iron permease [Trametes versicolor FP-101664 SS1]|uniref:iron permease n=1 Tax=Trametes versicolor (strain FP-101664) TaxID=717944 RepID=UPI0004621DCA|nr:iron permease [Trametes versicolor FP-101664 SS1]EIW57864.1 iron permease [Trametes versicolor FP-101664 SS1]
MVSVDDESTLPPSPIRSGKWDFVFWMVYLSSVIIDMLSALDLTAVSTSLPSIVSSLHGTDFIWVGGAYTVASSAVLPFVGNLVSTFGRKPVLVAFILAFALGSALSGAARSMNMLIAGRAVQGFGGGGCFSITEIIYADLVPLTERGKLQGMTAAAWALACAIGPPIGGALTQHGAWRWIFFLNIPVCAVALVLNCIFLRTDTRHRKRLSLKRKVSQMDLLGASLMTGSTVLVFLATTWGGLTFPWSSPQVLSLLIIGGIGMLLFFVIERYWLKGPTVPKAFFADRTTFGGYLGTFFHGICSIATIYYYPVYLQAAQGATSLGADVDVLPLATVIPAAAILTGLSVNISDRYRPQSYIGWAFTLVGFGILSLLDEHSSRAMYLAFQVPVTIGIGIVWISSQFAVLAPAPESSVTHALAFFTFTRTVAQGWGIVIGGAILQNALLRELPTSFTSTLPEGVQIAYAAIETISSLPEALKWEVRAAFARATRQIWLVMLGVAGAGLLSCLLLREVHMRAAPVEEETWDCPKNGMREMSLDVSPHVEPQDGCAQDGTQESPTQEISVEAGLLR